MTDDFPNRMKALKQSELDRLEREVPLCFLKRSIGEAPEPRHLVLPEPLAGIAVIAEVKRASPSAGDIRPDLNPVELAGEYADGGAAAISVLTEPNHFKGSVEDLVLVRSRVDLPVLRKDFIIDPYDIYRSRGLGADLVLLIAAMLDRDSLERMVALALELSLIPLVEVHSESDLDAIKGLHCPLIGVNNRDLKTMSVSVETSLNLAERLLDRHPGSRLVSESGIDGPEVVHRLKTAGYSAVLVGEYLVRSRNRSRALAELLSDDVNEPAQTAASIRGKPQ